jgi:hypothetical protein
VIFSWGQVSVEVVWVATLEGLSKQFDYRTLSFTCSLWEYELTMTGGGYSVIGFLLSKGTAAVATASEGIPVMLVPGLIVHDLKHH